MNRNSLDLSPLKSTIQSFLISLNKKNLVNGDLLNLSPLRTSPLVLSLNVSDHA